jgi:hypothetical protein
MNGFARAMISVALLGACAYGMKFTMRTVEVPESKPKTHTWSSEIPKNVKILKINFEALYLPHSIKVLASSIGKIDVTQNASQAEILTGKYDFIENSFGEKSLDKRFFIVATKKEFTEIISPPEILNDNILRLPTKIPLELSMSLTVGRAGYYNESQIDLQKLNIQRFDYSEDVMGFEKINNGRNLDIKLPNSQKNAQYSLTIPNNKANIWLDSNTKGYIFIDSKYGDVNIYKKKNKNISFMVMGEGDSKKQFEKRVSFEEYYPASPAFPAKQDEPQQFSVAVLHGDDREALVISVKLGKDATLHVGEWQDGTQ